MLRIIAALVNEVSMKAQAAPLALHVDHLSIAVPDLNEAIEWYSAVFGFRLERRYRFDVPDLRGEVAFGCRDNMRIELWSLNDVAGVPRERREPNSDLLTAGAKHIGFEVSNLQDFIGVLVREGVDIAATQRLWGQPMVHEIHPESGADPGRPPAFSVFLRDPGSTLIEVLDASRRGSDAQD